MVRKSARSGETQKGTAAMQNNGTFDVAAAHGNTPQGNSLLAGKKIAFIGSGVMGEAMIKALLGQGLTTPALIATSDPWLERLDYIRTTYGVSADVADHALSGDQGSIAYKGPGYAADVFFDIRTGQSYCDPKKFRTRAYPVNVEPGTNVVKGPYVAETLAVSVESDYVVLDL